MKSQFKKRNPVASSPIMRKGGYHGKSIKALRRQLHQELKSGSVDTGGFVSNSQLYR